MSDLITSIDDLSYKLPITNGLFILVILGYFAPFLLSPAQINSLLLCKCDLSLLIPGLSWFNFLISRIVFFDFKNYFFCLAIITIFRSFERIYGSRKFANYMFANFCVSTILELAIISALNHFGTVNITHLANGCYSYVFALYINYCKDIPKEKFDFFGISFSEKLIVYVLGCQMLFSSYPVLVACLSGLASGLICRSNAFNVCDVFRLPPRLLTIVIRCLNVLLLSNNAPKESLINGATQSDRRQQYMELYEQNLLNGQVPFLPGAENASVASSSGSSGVSTQSGDSIDEQELEQNVIQLQEMGFDSEKAKQILRSNNNDLSRATNLLLEDS